MIVQGTGVCFDDIGLLIVGETGVGKTSLAIELIEAGGTLVGDDGVWVENVNKQAVMAPVPATQGMIEVRGVGLLSGLPVCEQQKIDAVVFLKTTPPERLPDEQPIYELNGVCVPCFYMYVADFSLTSKVKMIIKTLKRQLILK